MLVSTTTQDGSATDADTVAIGIFDGAALPAHAPGELAELLSSGEAKASFKSLALAHAAEKRWLVVGLGEQEQLSAERMRVAAAVALGRTKELATRVLCWQVPTPLAGVSESDAPPRPSASSSSSAPTLDRAAGGRGKTEPPSVPELAAALVEGTILADYRFERFKSERSKEEQKDDAEQKHLERLIVAAPSGGPADQQALNDAVETGLVAAEAANAARDLQNRPGNDLTPSALARHARDLGEQIDSLVVEVEGRAGILERSMGAFAAVAQGSDQEPALITLRYEPGAVVSTHAGAPLQRSAQAAGGSAGAPSGQAPAQPVLGLVGKAITFDSGGISLKPGAKMSEMKFDMSGGAAVVEAIAAIARLRLPLRVVGVVGATENLPSGHAVKPGDIVTASNGKTIEVNNTDAEGRLVLADCLSYAVSLGAQRIVDLATLTGAVIIALGSTYAGLMANDEELAERVLRAGEKTGEIAWRLPFHEEYEQLIKARYADLDNAPEERKAGTIVAGTFLSNFVDEVPWAHLDIAGSAWDLGRAYAAKGAAGYGVRLLVELARSYCPLA